MFSGEMPKKQGGPGKPWLDGETFHLIDAYEEKWCDLRRGQLKAHQWEEVAAAVAVRLGLARPSKNGTQCRHKMEKLRQRYRAERQRSAPSRWAFFDRMDRMERGPLPISIRPPPFAPPHESSKDGDADEEEEEEVEEEISGHGAGSCREETDVDDEVEEANVNTRSINGILLERNWNYPETSRWSTYEGKGEKRNNGTWVLGELAAVVSGFREGFARLEKRRLELAMELERDWMEMEAKRAEMMANSQQRLVDSVAGAFRQDLAKKPKKAHQQGI